MQKHNIYYTRELAKILEPITESEILRIGQYPEEEAYNERIALDDIRRDMGWGDKAINEAIYEMSF